MAELVSILIPAYNAEKWIMDTIKSAVNQTYKNTEIILIDDGSTDNTLEICKRFASKSVNVISQRNMGAAKTRNKALNLSQGTYIQWLDADDILAPDKIERQIKSAEPGNFSKVLLSSAFGTFYYRINNAKFNNNSLWEDLLPKEWIIRKFNENIWMNPAVFLVSRKISETAGNWDERLSLDDDGEYFCRIISNSEIVKFIEDARMFYRRANLSGISKSTSEEACRSLLISLKSCFNCLLSLEDSQRTRKACLRYLQTWYSYFYQNNYELEKQLLKIADDMGGKLSSPEIPRKYSLIGKFFGWQRTKMFMFYARRLKAFCKIIFDWLLYKMTLLSG